MWDPYIAATQAYIPGAEEKIVFDKFHVLRTVNQAVDKVRRQEHKVLMERGDARLKGTKHLWLRRATRRKALLQAGEEDHREVLLRASAIPEGKEKLACPHARRAVCSRRDSQSAAERLYESIGLTDLYRGKKRELPA